MLPTHLGFTLATAILASMSFPLLALASDAYCDRLAASATLSVEGVSPEVDAGAPLRFSLKATITDAAVFTTWPNVMLSLVTSNGINGSHSLNWWFDVSADRPNIEEGVEQAIPANFGGQYTFRGSIFGYGANGEFCGRGVALTAPSFQVKNHPDQIDVTPPVVTETAFEKTAYSLTETVVVRFKVTDASAICTRDLDQSGQCDAVWHVQLKDVASGDEVDVFPAVDAQSDGFYQVAFALPCAAKPATYEITVLDVQDVWGNGAADVATAARSRVSITPEAIPEAAPGATLPLVNAKDNWAVFLNAYDRAADDAGRRAAWECFERRYQPLYDELVYRKPTNPEWAQRREQKLTEFFEALPELRQDITASLDHFDALLAEQGRRFFAAFPDAPKTTQVFAVPSLLSFNGKSDQLSTSSESQLFFGVDYIVQHHDDTDVLFAHEFFHVHHFDKMPQADNKHLTFPLWTEGFATYVSGALNPGRADVVLLMDQELATECAKPDFVRDLAKKYLVEVADISTQDLDAFPVYEDWFLLDGPTSPKRRAYCLGLHVVRKLAEHSALSEMVLWSPGEAHEKVKSVLSGM